MPDTFLPLPKRLHEMNRLEDMGRFPLPVYVGATANVLGSILLFYWLHRRTGGSLPVGFLCAVALVALNLLPVVALRWRDRAARLADTRPVEQMNFFADQHRFASWVYAVASGNLFFWIMLAWSAFDFERSVRMLIGVELFAWCCTFAPVWLRLLRRQPAEISAAPL